MLYFLPHHKIIRKIILKSDKYLIKYFFLPQTFYAQHGLFFVCSVIGLRLEEHPSYVLCAHNHNIILALTRKYYYYKPDFDKYKYFPFIRESMLSF